MTVTDLYQPRHAAPDGPAREDTAVEPVESPTRRLAVVPARRAAVRTVTREAVEGRLPPPGPPRAVPPSFPVPPAGLPIGHPPIPRRSVGRVVLVAVCVSIFLVGLVTAVGLAVTSSGSSGPTGSPQQDLAQWRDGGGAGRLQAITDDLTSIGDAGRQQDTSGMNTACRSLQRDIEAAQAYAPLPDPQAQASWSSALAHGARSATYCIAGTDEMSAPLIVSATTEIEGMTDDLDRTSDRIGALNGTA